MVEIYSDRLKIGIDEEGAQVRSILNIKEEIEYMWQGDASLWTSSSPVVFPVIGKLHQLQYQLDGKTYHMKSNGIIRYETLQVIEKTDASVTFNMRYNDQSYAQYPYAFNFTIRYEAVGNKLLVIANIKNEDQKRMYYNYAGHPGFNIPLFETESCNDYYIEFEKNECLDIFDVCETGQIIDHSLPFLENEKRFFIRKSLFQKEALVFQHPQSNYITIKSLHHNKRIIVNFEGFDNLAVWSPYKKNKSLRFICIEPWIGHTDFQGYAGEFSKRDEIAYIDGGQSKEYQYSIEFQ